jgi:hypothetical protein
MDATQRNREAVPQNDPSRPASETPQPVGMTKSDPPIYSGNEDRTPDSDFASGELRYLVVGNRGRLLDARRTPITVLDVSADRGSFVIRVDAFEDRDARWELGLEEI